MLEFVDEHFDNMALVEGALELNLSINPETDVSWAKQELERLFKEAEFALVNEQHEEQRFEAFLRLFFHQWGFKGDEQQYFLSDNGFIDKVLQRRKGIPVSLGAVLLYLGCRLGFPIKGIMFPTQFLLKMDWPHRSPDYINPFNGEYVGEKTLQAWLIGQQGPLATLKPEHFEEADNPAIIGRWLALIKSAMLREERYSLALRCSNLALTFVPDDPYEIRDRGFIFQQLECHQVAASDFQYFVDQCPDDPSSELLQTQINSMNEKQVTLH
ncbi:hypothetical protein BS333_03690 [Vibrio azureus]|uniref:Protein SirB1 N-terminal domain-containing protein n=1 Tax=Vibrio azureus NBRC 104587 TaxID=1219077 RepID=U3C7J7_9VIBR|nr:SirB1 family protein [Vibrio azureus]AUI85544.1 hypothetical protein BS333_03690 [Vibrio azureus]GAD77339.1 hypothetical protein VAZ01S_072_00030 [Vibrio azureus NBRC 104587]